jgi:hypothetical protein
LQIRGSQRFAAVLLSREGVHFSQQIRGSQRFFAAVLSIEGVCRFVGHSDSRRYYPETGFISAGRASQICVTLKALKRLTARQALASLSLEGVHFRSCFADSWVAESAHSVSRRYYPLIGRISWCSSQGPRKTHFLSVWGESSEGVACVWTLFIGRPSSPEL